MTLLALFVAGAVVAPVVHIAREIERQYRRHRP